MAAHAIHHVGVVVEKLEPAVETYERLFGAKVELRRSVEGMGFEAASVLVGDGRVELIAPTDSESVIGHFLEHRGPGLHHVAYAVDDIRAELAHLKAEGAELIDEEPREGLFGHEIAFVHHESVLGVLSELVASG
jgi:methylmalonyl-CoA/ethylmalonyl-CoA epimerase